MKTFILLGCLIPLIACSTFYRGKPSIRRLRRRSRVYRNGFSSNEIQQTTEFSTGSLNSLEAKDIIKQTRSLTNSVTTTLRSLAADPDAAMIIQMIVRDQDNVCLDSLEQGLAAMETSTRLVENAGYDIKTLIDKVASFTQLTNPIRVVHEVANILRILEPLVTNISPSSPSVCKATPDQAGGSLRSLAVLVDSLASSRSLEINGEVRGLLKQSGATIYSVNTFISLLGKSFSKFQDVCTADKRYNLEAISALGDLMNHLADLFGSRGEIQMSERIRRGKLYTERVVVG